MSQEIGTAKIFSLKDKNIIGVNPPVEDFAFFDLWSKPLGLLYLLERMRGNGNHVKLIDCVHEGAAGEKSFGCEKINSSPIEKPAVYSGIKKNYHRFGVDEAAFRARLSSAEEPDYILLTSIMTYWYGGVKWAIDIIRDTFPNVPIILGGIYARFCPEHALTLGADFVVTDSWQPDVSRPAMDLYGIPPYGVTMTSFGCPLSCEYCASRLLWPIYHRRSSKEVIEEIAFQRELGVNDVAFYDDALLLDKENCFYPICAELKRRYGGVLRLHTPNGLHVRQIDDRCAEVMKESGFATIRLSLESIDPKVEATGSGKVARGEYAAAVKRLRGVGYGRDDCETYILLGLPGQSAESVKDTIKFVHDCGGKPKLAEFSPIPGTKSFAMAVKRFPALASEPLLQNNSVYSTWISGELSPGTLQELRDLARV
ncbi:MAG: B12-binding domain-containing radical SAM protein [Synergistaceae bacterium]|nr:B12-binding domain-containing radical SAM protein [Synergistaceae bacterium]